MMRIAVAARRRYGSGCAWRAGRHLASAGRPGSTSAFLRRASRCTHVRVVDGTGAAPLEDQTIVIRERQDHARWRRPRRRTVPAGARTLDLTRPHRDPRPRRHAQPHVLHDARPQRAAPVLRAAALSRQRRHDRAHHRRHLAVPRDQHEEVGSTAARCPGRACTSPARTSPGPAARRRWRRSASTEEARRIVNYWADEGVTWFKAYTDISREALRAAIEAAHKRGLKFTGHLCSVSFREAVALGIDNLEHGLFTNSDYVPNRTPDHCSPDMRDQPAEGGDGRPRGAADDPRDGRPTRWRCRRRWRSTSCRIPDRPPLEDRVLEALAPEAREEYLTRAQGDVGAGRAVDDAGAVPAGAGVRARVREGGRTARRRRRSDRRGRRAAGLRRSAQLRAADRSRLHAGGGDPDHDAQRREDPRRRQGAGLDRRRASSPTWW